MHIINFKRIAQLNFKTKKNRNYNKKNRDLNKKEQSL